MKDQLVLLDQPTGSWRLDERTREIGRRGVAAARQVLNRAGHDHDRAKEPRAA